MAANQLRLQFPAKRIQLVEMKLVDRHQIEMKMAEPLFDFGLFSPS